MLKTDLHSSLCHRRKQEQTSQSMFLFLLLKLYNNISTLSHKHGVTILHLQGEMFYILTIYTLNYSSFTHAAE